MEVRAITEIDNNKKFLSNIIIGNCSYHLCNKKNIQIHNCPFCNKFFCDTHKSPMIPMQPNFRDRTKFEIWKSFGENHHPCPDYYNEYRRLEEEEARKISRVINTLPREPWEITREKILRRQRKSNEPIKPIGPIEIPRIKKEWKEEALIEKPMKKKVSSDTNNGKKPIYESLEICNSCSKPSSVYTCKYCGKLFCKYHSEPKPWTENFGTKSGHSCKNFIEQNKTEKKKEGSIKQTKIGIISIIFGILGILTLWRWIDVFAWTFIPFILGIFTMLIGSIAEKKGDKFGRYGFILGVIVFVLSIISLIALLFLLYLLL